MTIDVVLGAQWGDEGKGKVSRLLSRHAACCARFQGGANAGHTVQIGDDEFVFRQIPCGILHAKSALLGGGMALNPVSLWDEVDRLEKLIGYDVTRKLVISDNAHVVLPEYLHEDRTGSTGRVVGTTGNGIGQTYGAKHLRQGLRMGDLLARPETIEERVPASEIGRWRESVERFAPLIQDGRRYLRQRLDRGDFIVAEGAQGALLDIDHGHYPYVTSSNTTIAAVLSGLGIGPRDIGTTYLVVSAYMTKVGGGMLPGRMPEDVEKFVQVAGREIDGATNKLRQCGWLSLPLLGEACLVNRPDYLVLTRLDVLAQLPAFHVISMSGTPFSIRPEGWAQWFNEPLRSECPSSLCRFVEMVSAAAGVPVAALSFGRADADWMWLDEDAASRSGFVASSAREDGLELEGISDA